LQKKEKQNQRETEIEFRNEMCSLVSYTQFQRNCLIL